MVKEKMVPVEGVGGVFSRLPRCLVGMEVCATAHYWARELSALGHQVRLMPAQYVKAYIKRNKNDAADAEAICEAVVRPTITHFPIHHPLFPDEAEQVRYKLIRVIPWELIEQHKAQALKNHKRTIEQLAQQQCGLRACEAVAVLEDRPWRRMPVEDRLAEIVAAFGQDKEGSSVRRVP
jgi:transposase